MDNERYKRFQQAVGNGGKITDLDFLPDIEVSRGLKDDEEEIAPLPGEVEENRRAARIKISSSALSQLNCLGTLENFKPLAAVKGVCDERISIYALMNCSNKSNLAEESRKFSGQAVLEVIERLYEAKGFDNKERAVLNALIELKKKGYKKEDLIRKTRENFGLSEEDSSQKKEPISASPKTNSFIDADLFFSRISEPDETDDGFPLGIDPVTLPEKAKKIKYKKITTKRCIERLTPEEHMKLVQKALQARAKGFTQIETAKIIGRDSVQVRRYEKRYRLDENGEVVLI